MPCIKFICAAGVTTGSDSCGRWMFALKKESAGYRRIRELLWCTVPVAWFLSTPAAATSSDGASAAFFADEAEILVTATRRPEPLYDVPISALALSGEALAEQRIRSMDVLSQFLPGLTFSPGWGGSTHISIRGISSSFGAATTGIYLNDTPIQIRNLGASRTATNAFPEIFDLERVELLRGPQGTLFGAGSEGGAIRFITPLPALARASARVQTELGFTGHGGASGKAGGTINIPIIDGKLAARASGYYRRDGGWIDRIDPISGRLMEKNSNSSHTFSFHGSMLAKPVDGLTITPSIFLQKQHRNDTDFIWQNLSNPASGQFLNGQAIPQPSTDSFQLYGANVEYEAGVVTLFSGTSFFRRQNPSTLDYTTYGAELLGVDHRAGYVAGVTIPARAHNSQSIFTQEFRAQSADGGKFRWVAGIFYQNARQRAEEQIDGGGAEILARAVFGTTVDGLFGIPLVQPGNLLFHASDLAVDRQLAGFGQVDFDVISGLTATAGLRVTRTQLRSYNAQGGPFNGGETGSTASHSETPLTPKFGLQYRVSPEVLLYTSVARGFRAGGGNSAVPANSCQLDLSSLGLDRAPDSYRPDSLWSYEIGAKASAFEEQLRIAGSIFRVDWENVQSAVPLSHCGFAYIDNLGTARSEGFDLQVALSPMFGLTVSGAVAYTDAHSQATIFGAVASSGKHEVLVSKGDPMNVAPWKISLSADYEIPFLSTQTGHVYVRGNYHYSSGYAFGSSSNIGYDPYNNRQEATHIAGMQVGFRNGSVGAALFADNLLNSRDRLATGHNMVSSSLFREAIFRPRTIGVEMSYQY